MRSPLASRLSVASAARAVGLVGLGSERSFSGIFPRLFAAACVVAVAATVPAAASAQAAPQAATQEQGITSVAAPANKAATST
ncbi:MAG TPA: hypothetical protein VGH68_21525, partial [Paraburkholderia sp.]